MERITSTQNKYIKLVKSLSQKKNRGDLLLAEGEKCVTEALRYARVEAVISDDEHDPVFLAAGEKIRRVLVSGSVMNAVCDAKTPQHICAVVRIDRPKLTDIKSGLYAALEDVSDPGNVGTIIRTADAAGAKGVILSRGCADWTSPKVVRSTMGSIFHIPVMEPPDFYKALSDLSGSGICVVSAALDGDENAVLPKCSCILIGNESRGLSERAKAAAKINIKIPIFGEAESLNAGAAAAILMYRAVWPQNSDSSH